MSPTGKLVRKDDPTVQVTAVLDVIPAHAFIAGASLSLDGALELDFAGNTQVDWNNQRPIQTSQGRLFLDDAGDIVPESDVVLLAEDGEQYPATIKKPVAPLVSMMDALHQAVRGARVRRGFWSPRTCVRYVNGEGFVIEDIANPGLFTPYDPFSHDINATDWEILTDDAPPSGADSLDSVGVAEATVTPLRTAKTTRLGERVIQHGADTLDPLETLELYISRTRPKDAGRLADVLLGRFGDLLHVLGASVSELTQVVDTPIALDLKLLHDIAGRLLLMPIKRRNVIASWSTLLTYLRVQMAGSSVETFRGLFLDTRNQLIADEVLGYGTVSHAPVYPREIIKRALQLGASSVILSHQHPSGDPTPSRPDIEITKQVIDAGKPLGITVYDHIIVGTERTESMKALGLI